MPETEVLPGLETPAIPALTEAAKKLKEVRRERMALTRKEVEAAEDVLLLMHENKLESYRDTNFDPPVEVNIVRGKEKVKVKLKEDDDETDED